MWGEGEAIRNSLQARCEFHKGFLSKPFLGLRASAKPASYPVSWHDAIVTDGQQCRQQRPWRSMHESAEGEISRHKPGVCLSVI